MVYKTDKAGQYATNLPHIGSYAVMWEEVSGGQSKELFLVASTEEWQVSSEGFYGWILKENDWFTPVYAGFDGWMYVTRADEHDPDFIKSCGSDDRHRWMLKYKESIRELLSTKEILERVSFEDKYAEYDCDNCNESTYFCLTKCPKGQDMTA